MNALIKGLDDSKPDVRLRSALALGRFDMESAANNDAREISFLRLGIFDGTMTASFRGFSPAVTNAIPALENALNDSDESVRAAAKFALDEIEKANTSGPISILPAVNN